jgi:hypothetical protein
VGGDSVVVDDSNGMPFGQGGIIQGGKLYGTIINLSGIGSNTLTLQGSRGIAGTEIYAPGEDIQLDNLLFNLKSGIASVTDKIQITGIFGALDVQTSSSVALSGSNGSTQQLSFTGGVGGGTTLTYANKPNVTVDQSAPNAFDFLDATAAATGEQSFGVNMHAAGDNTTIDMTPKNVVTYVTTNAAPVGNNDSVTVWGNAAKVEIGGNSTTLVSIGFPLSPGLETTRGIQANIQVGGASSLSISDSGNVSTQENVMVTPGAISGSGLFANDNVEVLYGSVGQLNITTGQKADSYTVTGEELTFRTNIKITDLSSVSFSATVLVDGDSLLNLTLVNSATPVNDAQLSIQAVFGGTVSPNPLPTPDGVADVLNSFVNYTGFGVVGFNG